MAMKKKTKTTKTLRRTPVRSADVPVTSAMLYEMEERINHRSDAGIHRVSAEFVGVKADIAEIRSEIVVMKSDVAQIKSEMVVMKSDIVEIKSGLIRVQSDVSSIKSELHRVALLVEEQIARNKYVMDGYAQLYDLIASRT